MRRLTVILALVGSAVAVLTVATPAAASNGAIVIKGAECSMLAADGSIFTDSQAAQEVSTPSGNSRITCVSTQPDSVRKPASAVHFDVESTGFSCDTGFATTDTWSEVVTPSGHVRLTCTFTHQH